MPKARGDNSAKKRKAFQIDGADSDQEAFPRGRSGYEQDAPAGADDTPAPTPDEGGNDLLFDSRPKKERKPKKKRPKKDKKVKTDDSSSPMVSTKLPAFVDGLSFHRLNVGSMLLGCVKAVNELDVVVALPNALTGFLSIRELSDAMASRIDAFAADDNDDDDDDDEEELPSLASMLPIGSLVPVCVVKLDKSGRKKRVELSCRPSLLNSSIAPSLLTKGMAVWAAVQSTEDRGLVLDIGVEGVRGFLKTSKPTSFQVGQPLRVLIEKRTSDGRTVHCTAESDLVDTAVVQAHADTTLDSIKPGQLVQATVLKTLPTGVVTSILGFFTATADLMHLKKVAVVGWSDKYAEHKKLKARVIHVDSASKRIGISFRPHLVKGKPYDFDADKIKVGQIFQAAKVTRVDNKQGLMVDVADYSAHVHISHVSEKRIDNLGAKYAPGKAVQCRVLSLNQFEGVAVASMLERVLSQAIVRFSDIRCGMSVNGTIVAVEKYGLLVKLSDSIKAICPRLHVSDAKLRKNSAVYQAKFKVGQSLECRVLEVDSERRRVTLTHKKTLLESELAVLNTVDKAAPGTVFHGVVTKTADHGVIVSAYQGVHGLVPVEDLRASGHTAAPQDCFFKGQVVKVMVKSRRAHKLKLTFDLDAKVQTAGDDSKTNGTAKVSVKEGEVLQATVSQVHDDYVAVTLAPSKTQARLPLAHLTDHSQALASQLIARLQPNQEIGEVVVWRVTNNGQKVTVSAKPALLLEAKQSGTPSSLSDWQEGSVYTGVASNATDFGVFVDFLHGHHGLAPRSAVADAFVTTPSEHFERGQTVRAVIKSVDADQGRVSLSLKASEVRTDASAKFDTLFVESLLAQNDQLAAKTSGQQDDSDDEEEIDWTPFAVGSVVTGRVQAARDYGTIFDIVPPKTAAAAAASDSNSDSDEEDEGVAGFAVHPFHTGPKSLSEGAEVPLRILDIDKAKGIIDVSLQPDLLKKAQKAAGKPNKAPKVGAKVAAVVQLVKTDYLVVSLPKHQHQIGFAAAKSFNLRTNPHSGAFKPGLKTQATVLANTPKLLLHVELATTSNSNGKTNAADSSSAADKHQFFDDSVKSSKDLKVGKVVSVKVVKVDRAKCETICGFGAHTRAFYGRLHAYNAALKQGQRSPFHGVTKGSMIRAKILSVTSRQGFATGGPAKLYDLEQVVDDDSAAIVDRVSSVCPTFTNLKAGQMVRGYVMSVGAKGAWVSVSPDLRGFCHVLELSRSPEYLADVSARLQPGDAVMCVVCAVDAQAHRLELSLRLACDPPAPTVARKLSAKVIKQAIAAMDLPLPGSVLVGRVTKVIANSALVVALGRKLFGRVHVTDIDEEFGKQPLKRFSVGQFVQVCVVQVTKQDDSSDSLFVDLNIRLAQVKDKTQRNNLLSCGDFDSFSVGSVVHGYVKNTTKSGCFVLLSRQVTARCVISQLSDKYVPDIQKKFPAGKLVEVRITSLDKASKRVEVSCKRSIVAPPENQVAFEDLSEGQIVKGVVKSTTAFGAFVRIKHSQLVGLCHKSNLAEEFVSDPSELLDDGQKVVCKVLKLDPKTRKINLGMKPSLFEVDGDEDGNEEEEADAQDEEMSDAVEGDGDSAMADSDADDFRALVEEEGGDFMESSDDEQDETNNANGSDSDNDDDQGISSDDDEASSQSDEESSEDEADESAAVAPMSIANNNDENDSDDSSSSDSEDDKDQNDKSTSQSENSSQNNNSTQSRRALAQERKKRAADASSAETRLASSDTPESVDDFERLVVASPHSSFVWAKYMAHHLHLGEVDAARQVAERALARIPVGAEFETEKFNVWIAFLNLENLYGDQKSTQSLFERALQFCDQARLYQQMAKIYDHSDKVDEALAVHKAACRRENNSLLAWQSWASCLFRRERLKPGRDLMQRALQSLDRRHHVALLSKFAQLEFRHGSVERGRTLLEGVLANFPKKIDVWSVYMDQEMKRCREQDDDSDALQTSIATARRLLERATSLGSLSSKKMKFLFKKFLAFENEFGDDDSVDRVKQLAREWVQSRQQTDNE